MTDKLERRVAEAAEAALAERGFVTAVDVLVSIGWLAPARVDEWREGTRRVPRAHGSGQSDQDHGRNEVLSSVGPGAWPPGERDRLRLANARPPPAAVLQGWRPRNRARLPDPLGFASLVGGQAQTARRARE